MEEIAVLPGSGDHRRRGDLGNVELGYFLHVGRLMRGWLEAASGGGEDGLAETLEGWRSEAQTLHLTYGLTLLARAHLRSGRWQEGLAAVNEALAWTGAHDQGYLRPSWRGSTESLSCWEGTGKRRWNSSEGRWLPPAPGGPAGSS